MTQVSIKNIAVGALAVLALLIALNVAGFFFHMRSESTRDWAAHSFSGAVVAVSPGLLKIKDVYGEHTLFRLTDATAVRRGKEAVTAAALLPGSYVVIESVIEDENLTARTIRIVRKELAPPEK